MAVMVDAGPESSTTWKRMILSVLAKSMLFLLLRFRRSTVCPTVYLRKSMRISTRSAVPCRQDLTAWTTGTIPPSVPTM